MISLQINLNLFKFLFSQSHEFVLMQNLNLFTFNARFTYLVNIRVCDPKYFFCYFNRDIIAGKIIVNRIRFVKRLFWLRNFGISIYLRRVIVFAKISYANQ